MVKREHSFLLNKSKNTTYTYIIIISIIFLVFFDLNLLNVIPSIYCAVDTIININLGNDTRSIITTIQVTLFALVVPMAIFLHEFIIKDIEFKQDIIKFIFKRTWLSSMILSSSALLLTVVLHPLFCNLPLAHVIWAIWLAVNLAITVHFMVTSLKLIHLPFLYQELSEYVITRIYRQELLSYIESNKYLQLGSKTKDRSTSKVWFGESVKGTDIEVKINLSNPKILYDVDIQTLEYIINIWSKRNARCTTEDRETKSIIKPYNTPELFFSLRIGQKYEGVVEICTVRNGKRLRFLEKLAIRQAFKFSGASYYEALQMDSKKLLKILAFSITQSIKTLDQLTFDEVWEQLIKVHKLLLKNGEFVIDGDKPNNYATIELYPYLSWGRGKLYEEWNLVYRDIFEEAVTVLEKKSYFFNKCCYFGLELVSHIPKNASMVGLKDKIDTYSCLYLYLDKKWTKSYATIEQSNKITIMSDYVEALKNFIAQWEKVYLYILIPKANEVLEIDNNTWDTFKNLFQGFEQHLTTTIFFLIRSVVSKNEIAAQLWVEHLLQLHKQLSYENYNTELKCHGFIQVLGRPILLEHSWDEVKLIIATNIQNNEKPVIQKELFFIILENYQQDTYIILTSFLLLLALNSQSTESTIATSIIKKLLNIKDIDKRPFEKGSMCIKNFEDYFVSFLRRSTYHHFVKGEYGEMLNNLASTIESAMEEEKISCRIYSMIGSSIDKIEEADVIISAIIMDKEFSNIKQYEKLLKNDDRITLRLVEKIEQRIKVIDDINPEKLEKYELIYHEVIEKELKNNQTDLIINNDSKEERYKGENTKPQPDSLKIKLNVVKKTLEDLLELLRIIRAESIKSIQPTGAKLEKLAKEVSSPFNKDTADFPISLFKEVKLVKEPLEKFSCRTNPNFPKGTITDPQMDFIQLTPHSYEVSDILYSYLILDILKEANRLNMLEEISVQSENDYAAQIIKYGNHLLNDGLKPILIAESSESPEWINRWRNANSDGGKMLPNHIVITKQYSHIRGHMFDVCDIPLYMGNAKLDATLLLPVEVLSKIKFKEFESGYPVEVSFEDDINNPWEGTLTYHWERQIVLDTQYKIYKLSYSKDKK